MSQTDRSASARFQKLTLRMYGSRTPWPIFSFFGDSVCLFLVVLSYVLLSAVRRVQFAVDHGTFASANKKPLFHSNEVLL